MDSLSEAEDGVKALRKLANSTFDLIISDWNMPKKSGLEFLKAMRADARHPKIPVLLITAEARNDNIVDALKAGADGYIVKPFSSQRARRPDHDHHQTQERLMTSSTPAERESLQVVDKTRTQARLGAIARELHDALRALGAAPELQRVIREIPDTRSRLAYVGEMTEKAAHRVLNLVDDAMPTLDLHGRQASDVVTMIRNATVNRSFDASHSLLALGRCAAFAEQSVSFAAKQKQTLSEIMLTQDFQDLSGQVIKKVIDMITRTESQLVQLLIEDGDVAMMERPVEAELQGPQTPENALVQDDVDDLLASLGF